jgi:ubiquinone biosynthesis protein
MDGTAMDVLAKLDEHLRSHDPLGSALAAYLSSRVDLLTQAEASELAVFRGEAAPMPFAEIRKMFTAETGARLEDAFASLIPEPFDSGPIAQWHRGVLETGESVLFKVAHEAIGRQARADLDSLLPAAGLAPASGIGEEFKGFLDRSLDLRREAEDLIELRDRCKGMGLVKIPEVHQELSGGHFLTLSELDGSTVAERSSEMATATGDHGARLARRLCRAWLRLVLSAKTVPVTSIGRNVLLLDDGKVAFCGGPLQFLSAHVRDQLCRYLAASAINDHQSMADVLLDLSQPRSPDDERRLRHQLRHTAPFRDGGFDGDTDTLSRTVLAHGHRMTALGFRPSQGLLAFRCGLATLTRQAALLAPGESPFREAFQEARLYQLFTDTTRISIGSAVAPLVELPRKLDRGLTLAAEDASSARQASEEAPGGAWRVVLGLLMALAAIALLTHYAAPSAEAANWIEDVGAIGALIVGGLLLRAAAR